MYVARSSYLLTIKLHLAGALVDGPNDMTLCIQFFSRACPAPVNDVVQMLRTPCWTRPPENGLCDVPSACSGATRRPESDDEDDLAPLHLSNKARCPPLHMPNMPPPPPACLPAASPCIFSLTLILTSKNLATHRSRQTDSPLLRSPSR